MSETSQHRAALFMESAEDFSQDPAVIERWLQRWNGSARLLRETEYTWEVEASLAALAELPRRMFVSGTGTTYPISPEGKIHAAWNDHFDDGRALPGFGGRPPNKSLERTRDR